MPRIVAVDLQSADPESQPLLDAVQKSLVR